MTIELHELYASENGDRWSLGREADTNRSFVLHEANPGSGGTRTEYGVEDFLMRDRGSPQHRALAQVLIATQESEASREP